MKCKLFLIAALALASANSTVFADANFQITEVYFGLSGSDGTEDWIEVTNLGDMVGDTGRLFYDDSSADIGAAGHLDSFMLNPGESAVFLVDNNVAAVDEFNMIWNGVANVGLTNGGGGLGQSNDAAFLLDSMGETIDAVGYGEGLGNVLLDTEVDGTQVYATVQAGVFGATSPSTLPGVLSNTFANDNLNDVDPFLIRLAGNPGISTIPEPASGLALCVVVLFAASRRRK